MSIIFSNIPSQVRLYTSNHSTCVGVGQIQSDEEALSLLEKWGSPLRLRGRAGTRSGGLKRVVVKIVEALKPANYLPHKGAPPAPDGKGSKVTMKDAHLEGGFALWDLAHVRLASACRTFQGLPVPSGSEDPQAYKDDFFEAPKPAQAVYRKDDASVISGGEFAHPGIMCVLNLRMLPRMWHGCPVLNLLSFCHLSSCAADGVQDGDKDEGTDDDDFGFHSARETESGSSESAGGSGATSHGAEATQVGNPSPCHCTYS